MIINKKYTKNFTKGRAQKIQYIVIHDVGSVSTAKNNADYFANNAVEASAHYFVDKDEIWQSVRDEDTAWHCGAVGGLRYVHAYCRNSNSIGTEMCLVTGKIISETVLKKTIELTRALMLKYGIPASNVIRHKDVTNKNCPASLTDTRWKQFKNEIAVKAPVKPKAAKPPFAGILKLNSTGSTVKVLQKLLKEKGYDIKADGTFGPKTLSAVKDFQKKKQLKIDGMVGKLTWDKL